MKPKWVFFFLGDTFRRIRDEDMKIKFPLKKSFVVEKERTL